MPEQSDKRLPSVSDFVDDRPREVIDAEYQQFTHAMLQTAVGLHLKVEEQARKGEVTADVLAERFVAFAQTEQGVELRKGEMYGATLENLIRPGEKLHSNRRGPALTGVEPRCADCGNLFNQQEVRACDYCVRYVCISCWPIHLCDGKRPVDAIMRREWANIEYKVQAFSADMDPLERAHRIEQLIWERIHYSLEEWANKSQYVEDMELGMKVVQRLLEEREQREAELAAEKQYHKRIDKYFPHADGESARREARDKGLKND